MAKTPQTPTDASEWDNFLLLHLLAVIEIQDSFDQLGKLAVVCDYLYSDTDREYPILFKALEKVAKHLQKHPNIGLNEFRPACSAPGCPCPFPCVGSENGSESGSEVKANA